VRGRLIDAFGIELCRLDGTATTEAPGYDATFREPKLVSTVDGVGEPGRKEMDPIILPGQFTFRDEFLRLLMTSNGNLAESSCQVLFFMADLEEAGLIEEATGLPLIRVGDRMSAVYELEFGAPGRLLQKIPNPPGLFVQQADGLRMGMGGTRNLLPIMFASRDQGMPVASQMGS
jgi:hypothetical protein